MIANTQISFNQMRYFSSVFSLFFAATLCAQNNTTKTTDHNFEIAKNLDIFNSLYRELDIFYVDSLDANKVVRAGIDAMLEELDPYTVYYPADETGELRTMTTGKYGGIGSIIRMRKNKDVIIYEPYENMPAAEVGLKVGDVLKKIDGVDLTGKDTEQCSSMLRGDPGTTFILEVLRPGEHKNRSFKITRRNIKLPAITVTAILDNDKGYINLNSFTEGCSQDVRRAIISLKEQGAKSIVLDLRENGGGLLQEAVNIVNLFVPKGEEIVSTKGKLSSVNSVYRTTAEPLDLNIPLVVLVNGSTASAAEIVSGALQDLDRAVVVGARTYGKGLVQSPRELPYNATVKLTTSKYYIPSGRCIQAIDYKTVRELQNTGRIPDSLTNVFHTAGGREVRDGGGIKPDVEVRHDTVSNLLFYLSNDDVLIDFATEYCKAHSRPASVEEFSISDADFNNFKDFVSKAGFSYDRLSDRRLQDLRKVAEFEGYYEGAKEEFDALAKKLEHNIDREFSHFKKEICLLLSQEIVKRWFFQKGVIMNQLKDDTDFEEAKKILGDPSLYKSILTVDNKNDNE